MDSLYLHPRVRQQDLSEAQAQALFDAAKAKLVPFRGQTMHATVALLDWDHRIPSKVFTLHIHVCYTDEARARLAQALQRRTEEIAARDLFPEFDVPDYAGLPADESYDIELTPELKLDAIRLVSPWRREIGEEHSARAVELVRASQQFQEVRDRASGNTPGEAPGTIELEAVAWTPPCESGLDHWTLDVWWLTSFDGRMGRGWSFLVDLGRETGDPVMTAREFAVRAG